MVNVNVDIKKTISYYNMLNNFDKLPKDFGRLVYAIFIQLFQKEGMIMALWQNILNLRKKNGLSQEGLGEKVNVTRQTISNWELEETAPNPEQLKLLSNVLNVSIDELVDNNIENVDYKKAKLTEKQTRTIKKVLKGILFGFVTILVIDIIAFAICFFGHFGPFSDTKENINSNIIYVSIIKIVLLIINKVI